MSGDLDHHNRGGMYAFLGSMVFVLGFMVYLVFIHPGVDLDEKVVDPALVKEEVKKPDLDISKVAEPWVSTPEVVEYGHKLFKMNCALCHGAEGKGDGSAGAGLNPKPRNLVEGNWKKGAGIIAKYEVLTNGLPPSSMASWKQLKPADRWALAVFIQSITQNPGKDDPAQVAAYAKTAQ